MIEFFKLIGRDNAYIRVQRKREYSSQQVRTGAGMPTARLTGVHVYRHSSVDYPVDRSKENGRPERSTDWHSVVSVSLGRPTGRPKDRVSRPARSTDRQICSPGRIRTSFLESNSIVIF